MDYAETYSGRRVHLTHTDPETIYLPDIAHSLASQCRYNGHCRVFYSVAEHSVRVSEYVADFASSHVAMVALLHDAAEAYTGDCISPVKRLVPAMSEIERAIHAAIYEAAGLTVSSADWALVKTADVQLLADEAHALMPSRGADWSLPTEPRPHQLWQGPQSWSPQWGERMFVERFVELAAAIRLGNPTYLPLATFGADL